MWSSAGVFLRHRGGDPTWLAAPAVARAVPFRTRFDHRDLADTCGPSAYAVRPAPSQAVVIDAPPDGFTGRLGPGRQRGPVQAFARPAGPGDREGGGAGRGG